jgi:chromosomal replication initiation ATPase DnaA
MKKVIIYKKDRIDYILDGLARFYKINRAELSKRYKKPEKYNRKRIAIKLLIDVADCTYLDVHKALNTQSPSAIWQSHDSIKDDLSAEYGNGELKKEYLEIKEYLGL